jgi:hypothetical protein
MQSAASANAGRKPDFRPAGVWGHDRGLAPRQLDLCLWPRGTVQEVLAVYFRSHKGLSEDTLKDYRTREGWLLRVLGPGTDVADINIETLEEIADTVGPEGDGSLMYVTIAKRFDYLRAACEYAVARKVIGRDDLPAMPKLPDDGRRLHRALTMAEFRELRLALPERFRRFADLGYFTGQHAVDIETTTHAMLDPHFVWLDTDGSELWRGRYWRRNKKTPDCVPMWFPMEEPLRQSVLEWQRGLVTVDSVVVGHLWAKKKNFDAACDRCRIDRCTPNRDMRRSFASMLVAKGHGLEYVRHALGHLGPVQVDGDGRYDRAGKSSVATQHYMRATEDLIRAELRMRRSRIAEKA